MKQITYTIKDGYDFSVFLQYMQDDPSYQTAQSVLITMYTDKNTKGYIDYIRALVTNALPKADFIGTCCIQQICGSVPKTDSTVISIFLFSYSDVHVLEYDLDQIPYKDAINDVYTQMCIYADSVKGVQLFIDSIKNDVTQLVDQIGTYNASIPIFGIGAGDLHYTEKTVPLRTFGKKTYSNGLIVVLFVGDCLSIFSEVSLGWHPIGNEMEITKVAGKNKIVSLNHKPAAEIYKRYLGVTRRENFVANTCEFPLMVRRGEQWLARMPYNCNPDLSIDFTADVHTGEKVLFSYASKRIILESSHELSNFMANHEAQGMLMYACQNRIVYLKDAIEQEIGSFSSICPTLSGCFGFSEILFHGKEGGVHNSALVVTGFRECENYSQKKDIPTWAGEHIALDVGYSDRFCFIQKKDSVIPFEERIVSLLHAITSDLYTANKHLSELATIDALTKINNRRRIQEIIEYELHKRAIAGNLCIIMFDIDNFKHINDTYGHDTGDEVLVTLAQTVSNTIRTQDSIGRWGGEEFFVVLPGMHKDEAMQVAERIRNSVYELQWQQIDHVSISLGVACAREDDDMKSMYERVDERLYHAKHTGKNRVVGNI